MQTLPSFLTAKIKTTVDINGIATPFNRSLDSIQRFCRPLLFHKEHDVLDIAYSGSCFLFRCNGRNFLLCTNHQLRMDGGDFAPSDICLVIEEGGEKVGISPNEANRIRVDSYIDKTAEDILLVEYYSERNGRNLDPYFLSFDLGGIATLGTTPPEDVILLFAIGYPSRFADYEIEFDNSYVPASLDVVSRWCKLYLEQRKRDNWDLEGRIPLKVHEKYPAEIGDPDGFSGSPVLFIWQDQQRQTHLGYAGMITHGNEAGKFQVYDADMIKRVVKDVLTPPQE